MSQPPSFYRLSGKTDITGPLLGLVSAVAASFLISFIYAYAVRYIPLVYLNWLISFGLVLVVAVISVSVEKTRHNRNRILSLIGTLVSATACLYLFWVAFLCVLSKHELGCFSTLAAPGKVFSLIEALAENGWFSLKGGKVHGTFYAFLLVIEAIGYYAIFVLTHVVMTAQTIYCETCSRWLDAEELPILLDPSLAPEVKTTAQTGVLDWIERIEATDLSPYLQIELVSCSSCHNLHVLTVKEMEVIPKDGYDETSEKVLLKNLLVSNETVETLRKKLRSLDIKSAVTIEQNE